MIEAGFILDIIPHSPPFRFIDEIIMIDHEQVEGSYTFNPDQYFYDGHFPDFKITPGVILIETMAQIGLLPLGIYNYLKENTAHSAKDGILPLLINADVKFRKKVLPGETIRVIGIKKMFRHGKLSCDVKMLNKHNEVVCSGILEGVIMQRNTY
jgi:3-hydroxyacyl-[acyl-carrier-protein] dehydratase